jgi:hypothetical protein
MERVQRSIPDTEDKILSDLQALVRRAIALGRKLEKGDVRSRIVRAIEGESETLNAAINAVSEAALTVLHDADETGQNQVRKGRTYPYGHIKATAKRAFLAHREGLTRADLIRVCDKAFNTQISENGALTALKALSKDGYVRYSEGSMRWRGTHKLFDEEKEKQDAPEHETQGRLSVVA